MKMPLTLAVAALAAGGFLSLAHAGDSQSSTPSTATSAAPAKAEKPEMTTHECTRKANAAGHASDHASEAKGATHSHAEHAAAAHAGGTLKPAATPTPATPAKPSAGVTYFCPMHPEVTSDKKGRCPKCNMFLEPKKQG